MKFKWKYRKLGDFTYNILPRTQIKPFLMEQLKREWETDHAEFPDLTSPDGIQSGNPWTRRDKLATRRDELQERYL